MALEPTDDELLEFVDLLLSNLDRELREPDVLAKAVTDNREMWVMLYRVSHGFDDVESHLGEGCGGRSGQSSAKERSPRRAR